ncbi:(Fe-S)-binding protein [Desulfoluna butyratoxydans]|uniref:Glycolate oxidase iron-sulfur subunit n=1 Tax=Desulfoluna butyratoxydans TaxID=231438 RepID=A0A4U8YGN2_9BACT|nr:(Fe-S)-binding protein [Desulfoluna butyratoxydans]VFQ42556.1 alpha-helical ferredoxin [Desulfoluna butyratoxydans]
MSIDLVSLADAAEKMASLCNRCGLCQAVCPVYKRTGLEGDSARGKLALITALHENLTDAPAETLARLNRCTLCGGCKATCPRGVATVDAFLLARKALAEAARLSGARRALLRQAFADPKRTATLAARFAAVQRRMVTSPEDARVALAGRYPVPKITRPFFSEAYTPKEGDAPAAKEADAPKAEVLLFAGCLVDKVYPFVGEGLAGLLTDAGARVHVPKEQGCCGIPFLTEGDEEAFLQAVKRHLDLFSTQDFTHVVTPCATCTHAIKHLWPKVKEQLSDAEAALVDRIAGAVCDGSDLLAQLGDGPGLEKEAGGLTVTVHDPCHGRHSLKNTENTRSLLKKAGHTLVEMEQGCCGLGGSFGMKNRDLSLAIGEGCLARIEATGADVVVTSCPGCMAQIEALLRGAGSRIRVLHVVEILENPLDSPGDS